MSKILFLTRLYDPHVGGVEKHVKKVSEKLVKRGNDVTVITTKHKKGLASEEKRGKIKIKRFERPGVKFIGLLKTWIFLLKNKKLIKESDVVHCHDVFIWYLPFILLFPGKKVYTTFHGWEGKYPIPVKNKLLKKLASSLSTKTMAVGRYIEKYYDIKANDITYGATDIGDKKLKEDPKRLVYVGRLDEDTSLRLILRALEKLDGYSVDFCGDGPLKGECRNYGRVHGFVAPSKYIKRAKFVFVGGYLSTLEAFSYKSLPIACYENLLRKDYFKMSPFYKWILISDNPEELAEKIKKYSRDKKGYKKLVEKGYKWVKRQTWEKLADKYLSLWGIKN